MYMRIYIKYIYKYIYMYIYYTYIIYKLLYVYIIICPDGQRGREKEREKGRKIVSVWWKIERLCL